MRIELKPFQADFLQSLKRYPAFVAAVGTGKTMLLLLKIWNFCQEYPDSLALVVRNEYTDLRDSTIKDFERYFQVKVGSNKDFHFEHNNSTIMFRHASELNVLKNINLSIIGIEQAEEFPSDETFTFLRDRLRRDNAPYRQLCIIANVDGHNWIWKLWKNNPSSEEFLLSEATTFDNEENLPKDFVDDLRRMEIDAPNHYKRFVLNDWEETEGDDYVFTWLMLDNSRKLVMSEENRSRVMGVDVARFGGDETVFTILEHKGGPYWEQILSESHKGKDLMWTVGRYIDLRREFKIKFGIVDDDGLGGGVTDRLRQVGVEIKAFHANETAKDEEQFSNMKAEGMFKLREMIVNGYLKIANNDVLIDQLLTIRYDFDPKNRKRIISKDRMRKEGISSPDMADALMMAANNLNKALRREPIEEEAPKLY